MKTIEDRIDEWLGDPGKWWSGPIPDLLREAAEELRRLRDENDNLRDDHDCTYKWTADGQALRISSLEAEVARLREGLRELVRAATDTGNEYGCSGDLGARLSDARRLLSGSGEGG